MVDIKTPSQATITKIEGAPSKLPGYEGEWVSTVLFDNGWRCYAGQQYRNWKRWKKICQSDLKVTLKGLRAKSRAKKLYNADSKISIVYNDPHVMLTQYDKLFDSTATMYKGDVLVKNDDGSTLSVNHLTATHINDVEDLIVKIKQDNAVKHMTIELSEDESELLVYDDVTRYVIPIIY